MFNIYNKSQLALGREAGQKTIYTSVTSGQRTRTWSLRVTSQCFKPLDHTTFGDLPWPISWTWSCPYHPCHRTRSSRLRSRKSGRSRTPGRTRIPAAGTDLFWVTTHTTELEIETVSFSTA